LLNRLAACQATEALASESYQGTHGLQNHKRLARIVAYLQQHLRSDTPLENVARHAGMSPSAFSRFFHRMTGKTFVCYRNSCRVHEACRLLSETDHSITDIAFASGFENLANFNRQFLAQKKMTPHVYRRAYHPLSGTPPRKLRVAKTESLELNTA
jgi:transcriptional regulator GlxA family with amidase domain